MLAGIIWVLW